ncbi:MAG TPA: GIY-YIG nuclease family protein [Candidatus Binatia bacterium]|jgi:putative endonuclease|nr:GIY-YIG nuclease family protein [Candidatus Binatia bacterium]
MPHWYVYVVRCSDGSLYTGATTDVEREMKTMNGGGGSVYVRARAPVFLAYTEEYMNEHDALKRAASVKRLGRVGKERLLVAPGFGAIGDLGLAT